MSGFVGSQSEVTGGFHQRTTQKVSPYTVHKHAGCQRIVSAGNSKGQLEPTTAVDKRLPSWIEMAQVTSRGRFSLLARNAADKDSRVRRRIPIHQKRW